MTGTAAGVRFMEHGSARLPTVLNLQETDSGVWTDSALQIVLPGAGTYQLDASVRAALAATSPTNTYITARLFDATAGAVVPDSEVIINQINLGASSGAVTSGLNVTGPITTEYTVPGPRVIRLQGRRVGVSASAALHDNADGRTVLRFKRIA